MANKDKDDGEMVELIMESLVDDGRVNTDFIEVECVNGKPVLAGRVVADKQIQIIDEIMNDVLDIHEYENNVWVDDELAFEIAEEGTKELKLGEDDEDGESNEESFEEDDDDDD